MLISGVDDAGRGSIIGPLAIAGISLEEKDLPKLVDLGVKDSKLLTPQKRKTLAVQIKKMALECHTVLLSPAEIDRVVETGRKLHRLNRLEAQAMARVIAVLKPDVAYVDAADVLPDRFKEHITENLAFSLKIISEHKADAKYPIVSAASIIAKVERDKVLSELQKKHGNIGCGYPTDSNTLKFLECWIKKFGSYPDFVRKSWKPAKRIKREADSRQKKLQ
ncbi:MAG: ribonuclease HII [Candidatus Bathyarchaeum sp.]|nr:MAG: ribonuclease HII [Candidatus Bathyarchaeum sp.]